MLMIHIHVEFDSREGQLTLFMMMAPKAYFPSDEHVDSDGPAPAFFL